MSLIYSMLMSVGGYVEDEPNVPQCFDEWKLLSVQSPNFSKRYFASVVIFSVPNDYRMNERKVERASAQGLKLS